MAKGDTKTNQYLDIAANGTRADLPTDTCCETRSQTLIREVAERIITEEETRYREDQILQSEIDEIKNNPDVYDIVPTYAALQDYDTSKLTDQDIIRVLADETHEGASTYYRWSTSSQTFTYVGETGDYYTKNQVNDLLDNKQDLLTAGDGITIEEESGALVISSTGGGGGTSNFNQLTNRPKYNSTTMTGSTNIPKVPTATSELTNDSGFITSSALPTVNDATLTITQNGISKGTFTANDADDTTIALTDNDTTYSAGTNVQISAQNVISATDTTYSAFTGTDGSSAGAAGLVPAPATTDAGKFLKADGTWDTAGGGSGPTVVQTTGTSTTDVMSQDATTKLIYPDIANSPYKQVIGEGAISGTNKGLAINGVLQTGNNGGSIAIGAPDGSYATIGQNGRADQSIAIGNVASVGRGRTSIVIGANAYTNSGQDTGNNVAIGTNTNAGMGSATSTVALGAYAKTTRTGEVNIGTGGQNRGYNDTDYRVIGGVHDPQSAHDAATKGYVDPTTDSSAPTTATVGRLGQIQIDTTTATAYMCVAVDTVTPAYTWKQITA